MAQRVTTHLTDDLEPNKTADETVRFGIDGVDYEIDLRSKNADKLRKTLAPFVASGRKLSKGGRPLRRSTKGVGVDVAAVRAWAASNGVDVAKRGRIPRRVIEQFTNAMG